MSAESTQKRSVLVTGGAGYIGSHTCKALHKAGYQPIAMDNLVRGHPWAVKWGPFVDGDICDRLALDRIMAQYQPIAVIHMASLCSVADSVRRPDLYYKNNVIGSLRLLECMRDYGLKKMVFSSTCATYGEPEIVPVREDHLQVPVNPYGRSKLIIEGMLNDYAESYGIHSVSLRYFNAAGADADGDIGPCHHPETLLIPLLLETALGEREQIEVYGRDYDTPDGTCIRDFVHVSDLAEAHINALDVLDETTPGAIAFNLGSGTGHTVAQMIDAVEEVTGERIKMIEGSRRSGDPSELVADCTRARKQLGWDPKSSDINNIVDTAWRWAQKMRENPAKYEDTTPGRSAANADLPNHKPNPFL